MRARLFGAMQIAIVIHWVQCSTTSRIALLALSLLVCTFRFRVCFFLSPICDLCSYDVVYMHTFVTVYTANRWAYREIDGESFCQMSTISSPLVEIGWRIDFHPFSLKSERIGTDLNWTELNGTKRLKELCHFWRSHFCRMQSKYQQQQQHHFACFLQSFTVLVWFLRSETMCIWLFAMELNHRATKTTIVHPLLFSFALVFFLLSTHIFVSIEPPQNRIRLNQFAKWVLSPKKIP